MGGDDDWFNANGDRFQNLVREVCLDFDYGEWFVPRPRSIGGAIPTGTLAKFSSVLSNLLEVHVVERLNDYNAVNSVWPGHKWINQDPYFPDCILVPLHGHDPKLDTHGLMGIEVKIWYPMATELTARINESQTNKGLENSILLIGAWMPISLIWGKIGTIGVGIFNLDEVIKCRDDKWFNPPKELITEPFDTEKRTSNLQQTNVVFWELQDGADEANKIVQDWPSRQYSPDLETQNRIRSLINHDAISYRQENQNRNKIQRIGHSGIDRFKKEMRNKTVCGKSLDGWLKLRPSIKISEAVYSELVNYRKNNPG